MDQQHRHQQQHLVQVHQPVRQILLVVLRLVAAQRQERVLVQVLQDHNHRLFS